MERLLPSARRRPRRGGATVARAPARADMLGRSAAPPRVLRPARPSHARFPHRHRHRLRRRRRDPDGAFRARRPRLRSPCRRQRRRRQATRNALLTAEITGVEVPVFAGAAAPLLGARTRALVPRPRRPRRSDIAQPRRAPEREHAVEAIRRLTDVAPGLTLVTLGPLTDVALALARDPSLAGKFGRYMVMGGAPCWKAT